LVSDNSVKKHHSNTTDELWLTSKEMQKALKLSGCELMHQRMAGKFVFKKVGNSFMYQLPTTNGPQKADR
jgi:hypothetical protein